MLRDGERCIAIMGPSTLILGCSQTTGGMQFLAGGSPV